MARENAILNEDKLSEEFTESFDFDDLEEKLQSQLEEELSDLQFLTEEKDKIGSPDNLGKVITDVIWEQFLNQISATAGKDFIAANRGLTLDLRTEAHVQSVDGFEQQKYATHNIYIDYAARGEEYRSNFHTDPNNKPAGKQNQEQRYNEKTKVWETFDPVDGEWKKALKPDYRDPYEADRRKDKKNKFGSKTVHKDHQVADATIARDPEAGAYMTIDEKVAAANSEDNLYDLDSAANQSKSDHDGEKWLNHERTGSKGKGQTNGEYFGIDKEKYIEQDRKSKDAYEEKKKKKREEEIELGKQSQKEEAFRIGEKAIRAVLMQLLAELVREIIARLVSWFKSAKKTLNTLLGSLKEAIHDFIVKMKMHLINTGNMLFATMATAIVGPVFDTIKKAWMMLKQGWSSIKSAIKYIKNPANKGQPLGILLMEVGKIVITGMTGVGALCLSELIEMSLSEIPVFAIKIPMLGSLANILGIFFGAVAAGIIGAIAINLIERKIDKSIKRENVNAQIDKSNEVLRTQRQLQTVSEVKLEHSKVKAACNIYDNHVAASGMMAEAVGNINANCAADKNIEHAFDDIDQLFKGLED